MRISPREAIHAKNTTPEEALVHPNALPLEGIVIMRDEGIIERVNHASMINPFLEGAQRSSSSPLLPNPVEYNPVNNVVKASIFF